MAPPPLPPAHASLAEREESFRTLTETAACAIFITSETSFLYANPQTAELTGYSLEELRSMNPWHLIHPEDFSMARERRDARLRGEAAQSRYEFRLIKKGGEVRWLDFTSGPITFGGKPAILGTAVDVTEQKRNAEERSVLLGNLRERIKELTAMQRAARILQDTERAPAEIITEIAALLPPAFQFPERASARVRLGDVQSITPGFESSPSSEFVRFESPRGETGEIEVAYSGENSQVSLDQFLPEERNLLDVLAEMLRGYSDRRLSRLALTTSEKKHRELIESLDAIVWEADARIFQFTFVSQRAEALTGFPISQWLSEPAFWASHIHPLDRERAVSYCRAASASGRNHELEYRMITADGSVLWLRAIVRVIPDDSGQPQQLRGIMIDITERKRSEAMMRFTQFAIDHVGDGTCWVRQDGTFSYVNEAFASMLGYSREELLRKRIPDISPRFTGEVWSRHWQNIAQAQRMTIETELTRADGHPMHTELSINHLEYEGEELHCTFVRDVTARRAAEDKLRLQSAALESAANAIVVTDLQGNIIWANPAFTGLTGYSLDEVIGKNTRILNSGHHSKAFYARLWKTILDGHVWFGEMLNRRKDGSSYTEEMTITPVRDARGVISHFVAVKQDISARRKVEVDLRQSEERFRDLVENASYGIFHSTLDGRLLDANPALLAMLGYSFLDDLRDFTLSANVYRRPEDRERMIRELLANERIKGVEVEWKRKDQKFITVRLSARTVRGYNNDDDVHIEAIVEDVTERRALERQLTAAQKFEAIGKLAGGIAHDFNNVLGAILGWSELSESLVPEDSKLKKNLRIIQEQARKGAGLTKQLLAFARRQHLEPSVLNLNTCVKDVAALLENVIGKDIELCAELSPGLASVRADITQVEQVLMNLCVNARDAMPNGGRLLLSTRNMEYDADYCRNYPYVIPGRFAQISVADTGMGMDSSVLEHMFEPFFTTKEQGQGTGLGLATVYGIVKQHAGFIHVYSEPGRGTTFHVNFPVTDQPSEPVRRKNGSVPLRGGKETILIAEDHSELGAMAQSTLEELGYTVLRVGDGQEAVQIFEQQPDRISLVLLDVVMPRLSGPDAFSRMSAIRPNLKVLFASGYSAEMPVLGDLVAEGKVILQKPYGMQEMARTVRAILDEES